MDSNHRRFGLRDFSNLKTVRKVIHSSRATGSCWWAQMDSNHRRFGLRDFSNLKTVRKVIHSSRATRSCWWAQMDSNHRPHAYQACALTNWAMSPCLVEINGFEPLTPCLQGRCSSQLSYTPASSNHKVFVLPSSRGTLYITNAPPFTPEHSLQLKIW